MDNKRIRPTPEEILQKVKQSEQGRLKIYIGAAAGVGKTLNMLRDAHEFRSKGIDIVIGLIESHGRMKTEAEIKDLEIIPLKTITYKNRELKELNVEAIIERKPEIVIVDELAHTNVPGSKNKKRYDDIMELLKQGINVWTAMNIQHLESVKDIVWQITGVQVNERVPDAVLSFANELEIIDVSPETIRERISEGNVYSKDKIQTALNNFFRKSNLVALRELALREVADDIDLQLEKERLRSGVSHPAGVHEKILVCVNYRPNAEKLIRRGSRIATRLNAAFYVLNLKPKQSSKIDQKSIAEWEKLTQNLGGTFILEETHSRKVAQQIVDVCMRLQITQLVMGMSARTRWEEIIKGSIINIIMQKLQLCDILIISDRCAEH